MKLLDYYQILFSDVDTIFGIYVVYFGGDVNIEENISIRKTHSGSDLHLFFIRFLPCGFPKNNGMEGGSSF